MDTLKVSYRWKNNGTFQVSKQSNWRTVSRLRGGCSPTHTLWGPCIKPVPTRGPLVTSNEERVIPFVSWNSTRELQQGLLFSNFGPFSTTTPLVRSSFHHSLFHLTLIWSQILKFSIKNPSWLPLDGLTVFHTSLTLTSETPPRLVLVLTLGEEHRGVRHSTGTRSGKGRDSNKE